MNENRAAGHRHARAEVEARMGQAAAIVLLRCDEEGRDFLQLPCAAKKGDDLTPHDAVIEGSCKVRSDSGHLLQCGVVVGLQQEVVAQGLDGSFEVLRRERGRGSHGFQRGNVAEVSMSGARPAGTIRHAVRAVKGGGSGAGIGLLEEDFREQHGRLLGEWVGQQDLAALRLALVALAAREVEVRDAHQRARVLRVVLHGLVEHPLRELVLPIRGEQCSAMQCNAMRVAYRNTSTNSM